MAGLDLGFLDRIINVHWGGGGAFSFAGFIDFDVWSAGELTPHSTWLGGTSKDGKVWKSSKREEGFLLYCCVQGKVGEGLVTIAAGEVLTGPYDFGPGYFLFWGDMPAAGISNDGGLTWRDAGIPEQEHILKPPNPLTGEGADTATGNCDAVAYHPGTQTFFVGARVFFSLGTDQYWEDRLYSGAGAGSFSQVYSERRETSDLFKGYKWPKVDVTPDMNPADRLRVADTTATTPSDPGTLFAVSFDPNQQAEYTTTEGEKSYVSVKEKGGAGAILGGKDIHPPMAIVNSICGGGGHIVAVGWEDEDQLVGPVTFVSDDDGLSWTAQLSELTNTAPSPFDDNVGSNGGSCSFSLGTEPNADL